jgi:8-oxo-dGTP pyrophosphatase MutT (NUDIX family)
VTPTPRLGRRADRQRYVVGFAFDAYRRRVALIQKFRAPAGAEEMIGLWNGLGGKVRPRESYLEAMRREFHQEAGVIIADWTLVAIIEGNDYRIHVFATIAQGANWRKILTKDSSPTDETVKRWSVRRALTDHVSTATGWEPLLYPDVPMLLALALNADRWNPARAVLIDRRSI